MVKLGVYFEVGGSLVAADAMFLKPCHAVIHAKILTGINRENNVKYFKLLIGMCSLIEPIKAQ